MLSYSLKVRPEQHFLNWQQDPFGNFQARLVFPKATDLLEVEVDLVAEMATVNPFDFFLEEGAEHAPLSYSAALKKELTPYFETLPLGPKLAKMVEHARVAFAVDGRRTVDVLVDVNRLVQQSLRYDIRMEPGVFLPEETLTVGHGSCRDFAWLLCQLLRHLGYATRFASGYSIQLKPDVKPLEGPAGVEVDCTDLHAWTEVFLPGAGWVGLDATSGLLCGEGHIPLACTPDPGSAAPIAGSYLWSPKDEDDKVTEDFDVEMHVERVYEEPRVTKPYTEEAWARINALGDVVDRELLAGDVRLTMGGEPTFVSIDDPDGEEWNTAALGHKKWLLGDELTRRLRNRFAPGGVLHHGQGKWYPGEQLPRWATGCYWRKDGVPIWRDFELIAKANGPQRNDSRDAAAFATELATLLGVDPRHALPGYEDAWHYLWKERRLPINVDPLKSKLDDELERLRLAKVFEQGLGAVVGYALPITRDAGGWRSGNWFLRREHLFLIPGDSPMGYRLPLDSLPWVAPGDRETFYEPDPLALRPALPARVLFPTREGLLGAVPSYPDWEHAAVGEAGGEEGGAGEGLPGGSRRRKGAGDERGGARADDQGRKPGQGESAPWLVRTSLCVQPRNGTVHIFLPPVQAVEHYLELVAAIEQTSASLGIPVRMEGYTPPSDNRITKFEVTPDPGVIEVNVHPSANWTELSERTQVIYEEARLTRLGTEKFMVDGRHSGTGGGNHLTIGGRTPRESPLLRRPDLLRSLVGYWNNHPGLSYLFSGMFVGPTSQAPRVDEARQDTLHELDIAFAQIEGKKETPPWLVDRLFRHLLVDVTGNTHRSEFCIDKLYSPDSASGRQGILEMRAFEMPPHARMSLTQQLLFRALVTKFWKDPYQEKLVRWGTGLHDRFMLPHFVREDFDDVLGDLQNVGFKFEPSWFDPHFEFRFPILGHTSVRSLGVELRQAIEPWHVLGEQGMTGGTARYVDSSLERLQVKVRNLIDPRHVLTCNGRRVPLHPTGTPGEFVAGVRFRAWQPPEALHPTIGVHAPLVFDVLDTWNKRAVGGCVYHVSHPGGRSFDDRPRNALAAESRRSARFSAFGHTPGRREAPPEERNPAFPLTLDMRRSS